jgi:predicted NBD/HSP70 family sugar kinase/biotin operon repressor
VASDAKTLGSLRDLNRLRVVDVLRLQGAASRADIARRTGLSRATVSTLVGDLQARGLVVERPVAAERLGRIGRPPSLLALEPSAGAAVGIDFDHDLARVAVADLSRTVLAERSAPCDVDRDAQGSMDVAAELVAAVLAESGVERDRVLGVGVALSGPVEPGTGVLRSSTILPGWAGLDAERELEDRLGVTVHIDNDANLGALAEVTYGAAADARHAAYVSMSAGIGCGLIVDRRPYRGAGGTAGEIGHVLVDDQGPLCRCGNRGCLETLASAPSLLALLHRTREDVDTIDEVIALARAGDPACRRVIADAGRAVGRVLATLVNLFSPEVIVVGGPVGQAGDLLLDPVREEVERFALPTATERPRVVEGALGERANLLGALALVVMQSEHAVAARVGEAAGT